MEKKRNEKNLAKSANEAQQSSGLHQMKKPPNGAGSNASSERIQLRRKSHVEQDIAPRLFNVVSAPNRPVGLTRPHSLAGPRRR